MAKLEKVLGATSEIWQVFIQDSSSTTGAGLAGLAFNTASLTAYFHRDTDTTATAITLATMTVGTFTSSGFKEIDATNMPGWYQFCPPNAALASGAKSCGFLLKGATNMAPLAIEVQLTAVNVDSTGFALALSNASFAADTGMQTIRSNTAQAGAATTITLDASASAVTNFYLNDLIILTGGTGVGQGRFITAYNGTTKVATVGTWATNPDNTTTFAVVAADAVAGTAPTAAQNATAVWTDLLAGSDFSTAASIGKLLKDDVDATVSSRMATYTQPTGFLAATFPSGTVANTTNITAATGIDVTKWAGTTVATPATAGIPEVDVKNINNVSTAPVTTIKAVQGLTTADTIVTYTGNSVQTGDNFARLGAPAGASVSADIAAADAAVLALNNVSQAQVLTQALAALNTQLADSVPADGTIPTSNQALYMLIQFLTERSVSVTTCTVKKVDGSTTLFTLALNDATTPTSISRAT